MDSSKKESTVPPKPRRLRPILRQATLILPNTGERIKRRVTLRDISPPNGANTDGPSDRSPLLGHLSPRQDGVSKVRAVSKYFKDQTRNVWEFATSNTGQGILKCSIAYLLGSLATFVPAIAAMLGQQDGKHMVATITVYFHPARSQGSMFEAVMLALLAFVYATTISFTSMGVSIFFGRTLDLIVLGHMIVLIVFCGGGLGFVGWVKLKLANPLVNIACSLTSLAIITVLTKEGAVQAATFSDDKVAQVLKMIVMGVIATTAVCFLIKPVSARKDLRENMINVTDSFADMLTMITRSFLTGLEEELQRDAFIKTSTRYKSLLDSLKKNLKESKYEHYVAGTERQYQLEAKLVNCMQRLAQNIGGLRSAANTQFDLLTQTASTGGTTPIKSNYNPSNADITNSVVAAISASRPDNYGVLTAIDEDSEEDESTTDDMANSRHISIVDSDNLPTVQSPGEIFERFIMHLGPSMKSLAFTLKEMLEGLPYGPAPDFEIAVNTNFRSSLVEAIHLYNKSRTKALALLYKSKDLNASRPMEIEADFEEVAASCGHFSFSLQDFAEEMRAYLDILDDLKSESCERPHGRSWNWLKIWQRNHAGSVDPERDGIVDQNEDIGLPVEVPTLFERLHKASDSNPEEPHQQPRFSYRLWKALRVFRRDDVKYAIKVGIGAALYALPSFLISTRPFYQHWRGEWGLLSYMLVCSMTIGASNTTGLARFFGTCIGAVCAVAAWTASQGNAVALAAIGWLMSLWTSYIIVAKGRGPMGRFIMLTYNLSALYAYSLSVRDEEDDGDEGGDDPIISEIALHRVIAVLSGCLWGLFVTRLVWPISARRKFKNGLSILWLRMGLIWKRDPLTMLLEGDSSYAYMNLREEFELNRFLSQLDKLRSSAASEFELRGPFANAEFESILKCTSRMLDAFHAMNVVIMKSPRASDGEKEILKYTVNERGQLCSRISHLFQVLASSMKLEFPLNDALPNTDHARDRLLAKIFTYRRNDRAANGTTDEDFALLYAYALVTGQISKEIFELERKLEKLFGILDEDLLKLR